MNAPHVSDVLPLQGIVTRIIILIFFTLLVAGTVSSATVRFLGPPFQQPANNYTIPLEHGETISEKLEGLTLFQLAGLTTGHITTKKGTNYIQVLRFSQSGVFEGGTAVYGRTQRGEVTEFLQFNDSVFALDVLFSSGLVSAIENATLPDLSGKEITLLNAKYQFLLSEVNENTSTVGLTLYGGFGRIQIKDIYTDQNFSTGVWVNGKHVDARVRIIANVSSETLVIDRITYILNAHPKGGGKLEVLPKTCIQPLLESPEGMLSPDFDICYQGMSSAATVGSQEIFVRASGPDYSMSAQNNNGQMYKIPLAQLPGSYGNNERNFIFTEATTSAAANIELGSYFLIVSSRDVTGVSRVLRYADIDQGRIYFEDLAGGIKTTTYDTTTNEGTLLLEESSHRFVVDAENALAMDQNNDGAINGAEARFVLSGGSYFDFGPGFVVTLITPEQLFTERNGDEQTSFSITFGSSIDLDVSTPQGTNFALRGIEQGYRRGLTRYGILFELNVKHSSDTLRIVLPKLLTSHGRSLGKGVTVYLDRSRVLHGDQCGDRLVSGKEVCDPPGRTCMGASMFERGICASNCMKCAVPLALNLTNSTNISGINITVNLTETLQIGPVCYANQTANVTGYAIS